MSLFPGALAICGVLFFSTGRRVLAVACSSEHGTVDLFSYEKFNPNQVFPWFYQLVLASVIQITSLPIPGTTLTYVPLVKICLRG